MDNKRRIVKNKDLDLSPRRARSNDRFYDKYRDRSLSPNRNSSDDLEYKRISQVLNEIYIPINDYTVTLYTDPPLINRKEWISIHLYTKPEKSIQNRIDKVRICKSKIEGKIKFETDSFICNGIVLQYWIDGDGYFATKHKNGKVKEEWCGTWKNKKFTCNGFHGVYDTFGNGIVIDGDFVDGIPEGKCKCYKIFDGKKMLIFSGVFNKGQRVEGSEFVDNYEIIRKYVDDKPCASGEIYCHTSVNKYLYYVGEIQNNKPHGQGYKYCAETNRKINGTFVNGVAVGWCKFDSSNDNEYYHAVFADDKMNGMSDRYSKNGHLISKCLRKNDKKNGIGYFNNEKLISLCEYIDDRPVGLRILKDNGTMKYLLYAGNACVEVNGDNDKIITLKKELLKLARTNGIDTSEFNEVTRFNDNL